MTGATLEALNTSDPEAARAALARCCGSSAWVEGMLAAMPFESREHLHARADEVWATMGREDRLEAFSNHPRIGERRFEAHAAAEAWARREQSGMDGASDEERRAFVELNESYERRFGHVFLICASGRSAAEMLAAARERIEHDPETELEIAAAEQAAIMHLRLDKLFQQ